MSLQGSSWQAIPANLKADSKPMEDCAFFILKYLFNESFGTVLTHEDAWIYQKIHWWKWLILPKIIKNLNFLKRWIKKKSALKWFGHWFFWAAHTTYLMDFGVSQMVILVFLLGVNRGGVKNEQSRLFDVPVGYKSTRSNAPLDRQHSPKMR